MTILNSAEKNRVNKLISNFKEEVESISTHECSVMPNSINVICNLRYSCIPIDLVKKNTWYSGMELNKDYLLKDLGL